MKPPYRKDGPPRAGTGPRSRGDTPNRGPVRDAGDRPPRRVDAGSAYVDRPPRATGPDGYRPRPEGGDRPSFRPRPEGGDRPSFRPRPEGGGDRPFRPRTEGGGGDRPSFRPRTEGGDRPSFRPRPEGGGDRPFRPRTEGGGGDRPSFRPRSEGGDRPSFRPRPEGGGDRPFRPRTEGDRPSFRPRPEGGDRSSFRPRPEGGDRPSFRPRSEGGDRPSFRPRPDADTGGGGGEAGFKPRRGYGEERGTLRARRPSDELIPRTSQADRQRPTFGDRQFEPPYRAPVAPASKIPPAVEAAQDEGDFDPAAQRRVELRVHGLNAVLALFQHRPAAIRKLWFSSQRRGALAEVLSFCAREQIGFNEVSAEELQKLTGSEHHEGACVAALRQTEADPTELLAGLAAQEGPVCVLLLEQVGNPHNLGAILRSAAHFGVAAVLLAPGSNSLLSGATYRVAEGGAEAQPVLTLDSLDQLDKLGAAGFVLAATVVDGGTSLLQPGVLPERLLLAFGGEGPGLSDELAERAQLALSIPGTGAVESLNVAAATAVSLAAWRIAHPG